MDATRWIAWAGVPLAAFTAMYTAWLFAQAKARDLWQNPLLPPHFLVQALLAGGATLLLLGAAGWAAPAGASTLVALAAAAHLLLSFGELTLTHSTAHARLAAHEMWGGRWAPWFWAGVLAVGAGAILAIPGVIAAGWGDPLVGALVLVGLYGHEHAYVQAGQSVPLA